MQSPGYRSFFTCILRFCPTTSAAMHDTVRCYGLNLSSRPLSACAVALCGVHVRVWDQCHVSFLRALIHPSLTRYQSPALSMSDLFSPFLLSACFPFSAVRCRATWSSRLRIIPLQASPSIHRPQVPRFRRLTICLPRSAPRVAGLCLARQYINNLSRRQLSRLCLAPAAFLADTAYLASSLCLRGCDLPVSALHAGRSSSPIMV